jgi:uncharacterized protein (DUF433 family)
MSTVSYPHIEIRADGQPVIAGDGFYFKVRILVEEFLATGATPAQLQQAHPHLTLSQIHSALAYYYDHQEEIDQEIAKLDQLEQKLRPQLEDPALTENLRRAWRQRKEG